MGNRLKHIEEQMERTRSSLTDKLEQLEDRVSETVETVSESVEETVDTVKQAFDVTGHVQNHPWIMMGSSVALGYLSGILLHRSANGQGNHHVATTPSTGWARGPQESVSTNRDGQSSKEGEPSWLDSVHEALGPELGQLKSLALGTFLGVVRDMLTQSTPPSLETELTKIINNITVRLGGEPIQGPVLEKEPSSNGHNQGEKMQPSSKQKWDGRWDQLRGKAKQLWGQLTDNDLKEAEGDYDILVGKIKERTGETREEIEERLNA